MVLDITIVLVLAIFAIYGFKRGFAFTAIHAIGWVIALAGAYFGAVPAAEYIKKNTTFHDWLLSGFKERFSSGELSTENSITELPKLLSGDLDFDSVTTGAADIVSRIFADITFMLIVFAALFILIKLITWILLRVFSNDHKDGFAGFLDGLTGALLSMLKAAVLICIVFAAFVPVTDLLAPDLAEAFVRELDHSSFAVEVYENNPLLILPQMLFGRIF